MLPVHPPTRKTIGVACFQNQYFIIYLNEENKIAKAEWTGFLTGEDLREAFLTCLKFIKQKQLKFWIADNKKMKVIKKQDQEWIVNEFLPLLAKTSLEKMATISSEDIFNQMAMTNILIKATPFLTFEHQYFNDERAAIKWLQQATTEVIKTF
ncbi:STAS/SEC14 domain-containing protein [Adhaeribacter aquaticus]|uniref:STAS/SEC14 domain-containing protein n=1 Tax=Adhaeribacter aquaticus TaxID=299567 RepID=UPI00047C497D|nr:STAS/SEC14 domain-containing protein [Adhaeribacter aquaticus]